METTVQHIPQSVLSLFETDKEQRKEFVNGIIDKLNEGLANPLQVHLQVKAMEDILNQLTCTDEKKNKNYEAAIKYKTFLNDAAKNYAAGQKSFEFHNAKFTQMETGSKWHYELTGDPQINELYREQEALKAKISDREKFLQTVPKEGMDIIAGGGEVIKIFPAYKTSTTSISVTLK